MNSTIYRTLRGLTLRSITYSILATQLLLTGLASAQVNAQPLEIREGLKGSDTGLTEIVLFDRNSTLARTSEVPPASQVIEIELTDGEGTTDWWSIYDLRLYDVNNIYIERTEWKALSSQEKVYKTDLPKNAIDSNLDTRWTSADPQKNGQKLVINLGEKLIISRIEMMTESTTKKGAKVSENDYPREFSVKLWEDMDSFIGFYAPAEDNPATQPTTSTPVTENRSVFDPDGWVFSSGGANAVQLSSDDGNSGKKVLGNREVISPRYVADGTPQRWTSAAKQAAGMWFKVDFGDDGATFDTIELQTSFNADPVKRTMEVTSADLCNELKNRSMLPEGDNCDDQTMMKALPNSDGITPDGSNYRLAYAEKLDHARHFQIEIEYPNGDTESFNSDDLGLESYTMMDALLSVETIPHKRVVNFGKSIQNAKSLTITLMDGDEMVTDMADDRYWWSIEELTFKHNSPLPKTKTPQGGAETAGETYVADVCDAELSDQNLSNGNKNDWSAYTSIEPPKGFNADAWNKSLLNAIDTASRNRQTVYEMAGGFDPKVTRWTSRKPQEDGMEFTIMFDQARTFNRLVLSSPYLNNGETIEKLDYPRGFEVQLLDQNENQLGAVITGSGVADDHKTTNVCFDEPKEASGVRITLKGVDDQPSQLEGATKDYWWSISDVNLYSVPVSTDSFEPTKPTEYIAREYDDQVVCPTGQMVSKVVHAQAHDDSGAIQFPSVHSGESSFVGKVVIVCKDAINEFASFHAVGPEAIPTTGRSDPFSGGCPSYATGLRSTFDRLVVPGGKNWLGESVLTATKQACKGDDWTEAPLTSRCPDGYALTGVGIDTKEIAGKEWFIADTGAICTSLNSPTLSSIDNKNPWLASLEWGAEEPSESDSNAGESSAEYPANWGAEPAFLCPEDQFLTSAKTRTYKSDKDIESHYARGVSEIEFSCQSILLNGDVADITHQSDVSLPGESENKKYPSSYVGKEVIDGAYADNPGARPEPIFQYQHDYDTTTSCTGLANGYYWTIEKGRIKGDKPYSLGLEGHLWCNDSSDKTLQEHVAGLNKPSVSDYEGFSDRDEVLYDECPAGQYVVGAKPYFDENSEQLVRMVLTCVSVEQGAVTQTCLEQQHAVTDRSSACSALVPGYDDERELYEGTSAWVDAIYSEIVGPGSYSVGELADTVDQFIQQGNDACFELVDRLSAETYNDPDNYVHFCLTQEQQRSAEVLSWLCPFGDEPGLRFHKECPYGKEFAQLIAPDSWLPNVTRGFGYWRVWTGVGAAVKLNETECVAGRVYEGSGHNNPRTHIREYNTLPCFHENGDLAYGPTFRSTGARSDEGDEPFTLAEHLKSRKLGIYADWSYTEHYKSRSPKRRGTGDFHRNNGEEEVVKPVLLGPNSFTSDGDVVMDSYGIDLTKRHCWIDKTEINWGAVANDEDCRIKVSLTDQEVPAFDRSGPKVQKLKWKTNNALRPISGIYNIGRGPGSRTSDILYPSKIAPNEPYAAAVNSCTIPAIQDEWRDYVTGASDTFPFTGDKKDFNSNRFKSGARYQCHFTQESAKALGEKIIASDRSRIEKQQMIFDISTAVTGVGVGGGLGFAGARAAAKAGVKAGATTAVKRAARKATLKTIQDATQALSTYEGIQSIATVAAEAYVFATERGPECKKLQEKKAKDQCYGWAIGGMALAILTSDLPTGRAAAYAGKIIAGAAGDVFSASAEAVAKRQAWWTKIHFNNLVKADDAIDIPTVRIKRGDDFKKATQTKQNDIVKTLTTGDKLDVPAIRQSLKQSVDDFVKDFNNVWKEGFPSLPKWADDFKRSIDAAPDQLFYLESFWTTLNKNLDEATTTGFSPKSLAALTKHVDEWSDAVKGVSFEYNNFANTKYKRDLEEILNDADLNTLEKTSRLQDIDNFYLKREFLDPETLDALDGFLESSDVSLADKNSLRQAIAEMPKQSTLIGLFTDGLVARVRAGDVDDLVSYVDSWNHVVDKALERGTQKSDFADPAFANELYFISEARLSKREKGLWFDDLWDARKLCRAAK